MKRVILHEEKQRGMLMSADLYSHIRALIFDCDGVIVDSEFLKYCAWREAFADQGIELHLDEYKPLIGCDGKAILQEVRRMKQTDFDAKQIDKFYEKKYKILQQRVPPIEPMVSFIREIAKCKEQLGLRIALASGASHQEIKANLKQVDLEGVFDVLVSGSDDLEEGKNKPEPDVYLEATKQLHLSPHLCLAFEDTAAGVEAAHRAGVAVVAVPHELTQNHNFSKAAQVIHHTKSRLFLTSFLTACKDR